ncbi:peptide-methionine (S)-S-oxide reductase MsrA [Dongia soli]|uniref:Peptide methionine sulfoxide reductase MsrA n=1 Tax=Dongia soli TaxID=600628 RepID=A0ABU5EET1_9PROT|nr:peptide-methionine (S)-S-oxide reductase MsrA [Dongia soli]MDY0884610.1 peptide-methionine (S)-S-oxide reductase MsrA [Dongia soli]
MRTRPTRKAPRFLRHAPLAVAVAATLLLAAAAGFGVTPSAADEGRAIPAPAVDETANAKTETAVLAGGCFWGVQGVFEHVKGVSNAVSGYAGGDASTANYETVSEGETGHAESVSITFDPHQISYGRILQIFFSVAHDPTQLNRQGPDRGTNYRSAIFPASAEQARIAKAYIAQLSQAHIYEAAIVTTIEPDRAFYPAEGYHQDFLERNPSYPYIVINDLPKVENLKRLFPDLYRSDPVLVSAAATN